MKNSEGFKFGVSSFVIKLSQDRYRQYLVVSTGWAHGGKRMAMDFELSREIDTDEK